MADYVLIESRDPFECEAGFRETTNLAAGLAKQGHRVRLFLVQNGVFLARPSAKASVVREALTLGVEVLAEVFSLRERGIAYDRLGEGIKPAELEVVVDELAAGAKVIWH